jgi:DNA-binding winged helix-turn-helix (wHTH) protein/predicted ATPase
MRETASFTFPPFHLDAQSEQLWQGDKVVRLTPKAFAVLHYLVTHAGQLVRKEELIDAVWATSYISPAALTTCMYELRQALGERAQTPQCIETVRGRGYRFIAPVQAEGVSTARDDSGLSRQALPVAAAGPEHPWVGREAELLQLRQWLTAALQGQRQIGFITGEAGIGKTTLVATFLTHMPAEEPLWVGHGQCVDQHGEGEAYLPVLEALGRLCRGPEGATLVALLRQQAPSWLAQLPAQLTASEREAVQRQESRGARQRMLRELAEAVEVFTADRPLVLVLEDLHWCDPSTLEWLAYVARRRDPARLLVLATYRPIDAIIHAHAVHPLVQELRMHDQCAELALDYWSEAEVGTYMARRFPRVTWPAGLTRLLHQRTGGNPLFVATIVDAFARRNGLREGAVRLAFSEEQAAAMVETPESLRLLIEQQLVQLPPEARTLLEAASVVGMTFTAAAVNAGVEHNTEDVETRLADLARSRQFIRTNGSAAWPDGTVTAHFAFIHDLYREVLYSRVPAGRRVRWHRQIGLRLEAAYGPQARDIAAELAAHFTRGHAYHPALLYLRQAAQNASRRHAQREAIRHLTTGIELLPNLPDMAVRVQNELSLQTALGTALMAIKGYSAPDVQQAFARARELCQLMGNPPQLFPVLFGLGAFYLFSGERQAALEVAEELLRIAQRQDDPELLVEAHTGLGSVLFHFGELVTGHAHLEKGLALYDPQQHRSHRDMYGQDPGAVCLSSSALTLSLLGYAERARARLDAALRLGQELSHPFSLAFALYGAVLLYHHRQEARAVQEWAEATIVLATEHEFPQWLAPALVFRGWALAKQGQVQHGMSQMQQGLATYRAMQAGLGLIQSFGLMAEIYGTDGQVEEGLTTLTKALTLINNHGQRVYEAEIYRLQGKLLLQDSTKRSEEAAETSFLQALNIAQRQQMKLRELRAAVSLGRLWQHQGKREEAQELLVPIYHWFTEGFDTADLLEAKALLDELEA